MRKINFLLFFFCAALLFLCNAPSAKAYSDLSVESISISPATPAFNQPCTITFTAKNRGDGALASTDGTENVKINTKDFTRTSTTYPKTENLAAGATFQYVVKGYFVSEGEKNIGFGIDDGNLVTEKDETNNYLNKKVTVIPQYDLSVDDISIFPLFPTDHMRTTITVKVKNKGYASLRDGTGITSVVYDFPTFTVASTSMTEVGSDNPIKTNEYIYYKYTGEFGASGTKELKFQIDSTDQLKESDEKNNSKSVKKNIFDKKNPTDIAVTSINVSKSNPILNESIKITVTVKNNGKYSLVDDMGWLWQDRTSVPLIPKDIDYDMDDMKVTKTDFPDFPSFNIPLDPGKTVTYVFEGNFPEAIGVKNITFDFNKNKRLPESDYSNNSVALRFTVFKEADFRDDFEIENFRIETISTSSVYLKWYTRQKTAGVAFYKFDGFTSFWEKNGATVTEHSEKIDGLKPGSAYYFKVKSTLGDVIKESAVLYQKMPITSELIIISGPVIEEETSSSSVLVKFSTNFVSNGSVYLRNIKEKFVSKIIKDSSSYRIEFSGIKGGDYEYYLDLKNVGGTNLKSPTSTFSIKASSTSSSAASETVAKATSTSGNVSQQTVSQAASVKEIKNAKMFGLLKGKIILTVEKKGEAYYINPANQKMYSLGRPDDAFSVMREQGVGISNSNLSKIAIGVSAQSGSDSDNDGLSDIFEDAIHTDKNKKDSDGDGFSDKTEVVGGFDPLGIANKKYDSAFAKSMAGKILLQVEGKGEAWYLNPVDMKRYFLGRPGDAFNVMRTMGVGISNADFGNL
jgi:hypothetical protein